MVPIHEATAEAKAVLLEAEPLLRYTCMALLDGGFTSLGEEVPAQVVGSVARSMVLYQLADTDGFPVDPDKGVISVAADDMEQLCNKMFVHGQLPQSAEADSSIIVTETGFDVTLADGVDREAGFAVTAYSQSPDGIWTLEGQIYDGSSEGITTQYTHAKAQLQATYDAHVPMRLLALETGA